MLLQKSFVPFTGARHARNGKSSTASTQQRPRLAVAKATSSRRMKTEDPEQLDTGALLKYLGATTLQTGIMTGALFTLQQLSTLISSSESLPAGVEGQDAAKWLVTLFFLVTSIKSRIFSPLNASRPDVGKTFKDGLKRPWWTPPALTFPIVWTTIGVLRCISSVAVWEASGRDCLATPLIIFMLHLAVGDCWNHINNVEKKLGVAVPGVFCCWLSVLAVTAAYWQADPAAGKLIAPSAVWISIASVLVFSIWQLNGKQPLYPVKQRE